jgi:dTDP-4-dehydrorhamnose reductase
LGKELTEWQAEPAVRLIGLSRAELDITDLKKCRDAMERYRPDAVIHCAAYTAVDKAESEPDEAFRVNAAGTRNVALAAREAGAKLAYISTDYVFDGQSHKPYNEYDRTNPTTVYGKSKLAGEELVKSLHDRYFIVRTSWVYGKHGANFVKTMLKLGAEKDRLQVVHDQTGSPTYTADLAQMLLELVQSDCYGIYHASNTGVCTWFEFAKAIFEEKGLQAEAVPCTTAEFPRPAPRPAYSVMDHCALRTNGFAALRPWREALKDFLETI